ncbi:MAG: hypothetical protein MZU95_02025 [Desulfomicrobium escambiense]|nr:hypothetical protein [Desulfomicrobium escambiense]
MLQEDRATRPGPRVRGLPACRPTHRPRATSGTMERIGIEYDLLARESDVILHLEVLGGRRLRADLKSGVHAIPSTDGGEQGLPGSCRLDERRGDREKIIVRSNGTVTYVGKDIAYQLWKFGLLGRDFHYRALPRRSRRPDPSGSRPRRRRAGRHRRALRPGDRGLQRHRRPPVLPAERRSSRCLRPAGPPRAGGQVRSTSPTRWSPCRRRACARARATPQPTRRRQRAFIEVSGRKGLGGQGRRPHRPCSRTRPRPRSRRATPSCPRTSGAGCARAIAVGRPALFHAQVRPQLRSSPSTSRRP